MRVSKRAAFAVAMAAGLTCTQSQAAEPTTQELMNQIQALQSKVQQLESKQSKQDDKLNAASVDATVAGVLRDADRRSQLLQQSGNFTAGYSKGKFIIQDDAGDFVFHPWLQFQPRFVANFREDAKNSNTSDDFESGFEIRRMKIGFDGNAFTPNLTYLFLWATDRSTGGLNLEEAFAKYKFGDFAVKGGQYKDPFSHESLTSSKKLLAADRSLLSDVFTGGDNFVQGVSLIYDNGGPLRAEAAYTDGANQPNRNFQDYPTSGVSANFGAAGRVEYLAFGKWASYEDFTALGNKEDMLVIGGGVDLTQAGDTDMLLHTIDIQYETGALGLFAAYMGRYSDHAPVGAGVGSQHSLYDWGVVAQAAYLLNEQWEPFVRYDFLHLDGESQSASAENDIHEITVGVNHYMHGHAAKFTVDASWLPNGSIVADSGADILTTAGTNQYVLRVQFQLLI